MSNAQETLQHEDSSSAAETALELLREKVGLQFWMMTRIQGDDLIILSSTGEGFGLKNGEAIPWPDSLCWRMIRGIGPRVAPKVADIPAYASTPLAHLLKIGAYIGAPLLLSDGKVYGAVCGMDTQSKSEDLAQQQWLVDMVAGLLSAVVSREKQAAEGAAQNEADAGDETLIDHLTQAFNRRAWDRILKSEEARCARHSRSACVICVDIDSLRSVNEAQGRDKGDALLARTAQVLKRATRGYDVVARTGEDEFAVLAVECGLKGAKGIFDRLNSGLVKEGIKATLGISVRNSSSGLPRTFEEALNTLINAKRLR
jgi:diguanylate cyclase (GGDEF)-like protein